MPEACERAVDRIEERQTAVRAYPHVVATVHIHHAHHVAGKARRVGGIVAIVAYRSLLRLEHAETGIGMGQVHIPNTVGIDVPQAVVGPAVDGAGIVVGERPVFLIHIVEAVGIGTDPQAAFVAGIAYRGHGVGHYARRVGIVMPEVSERIAVAVEGVESVALGGNPQRVRVVVGIQPVQGICRQRCRILAERPERTAVETVQPRLGRHPYIPFGVLRYAHYIIVAQTVLASEMQHTRLGKACELNR